MSEKLTLADARAILKRAIEKGADVDWISAHAVVDAGGNVISMSRADGAPSDAAPLARVRGAIGVSGAGAQINEEIANYAIGR